MAREFKSKKAYLWTLGLALFVFIFVFLITYSFGAFEYDRISFLQESFVYDFYESKAISDFSNSSVCSFSEVILTLNEELDFQGSMFSSLEKQYGKNNKEILNRKKFYFLSQFQHYLFMKEFSEKCNSSFNFIFYFYNNLEEDSSKQEYFEKTLGYLKKNDPSLLIYSFDLSSDTGLIKTLKEKYSLGEGVYLVLNGEKVIKNFESPLEILNFFD